MERRWPAWAGLWGTFGSAVLWGAGALDARHRLGGGVSPGAREGYVVAPEGVMWLAVVLGGLLPLLLVATALTWNRAVVRVPLALSGVALLAAAWGWWRMPDVGWAYPACSAAAGLLALAGATLGTARNPAPAADAVARALLALAGVGLAGFATAGLRYWQWGWSGSTGPMWVATVAGALAAGAALLWRRAPGRWAGPTAALLLGASGAVVLVVASAILVDMGTVFHHEEDEVAWDLGTPAVALATALLAAAAAAVRSQWALSAASLAVGVALAALALHRHVGYLL